MPAFKFRFEKILTYRGHQEMQKQRELAAVQKMEYEQKHKIASILKDRKASQDGERKYLTGKLDPVRLTGYSRYYLKLKQMELGGREVLKEIVKKVEKKRQALIDATRQKKIYEKLRERHLQRYIEGYNRALQKENDEIGQQTFIRNH
jgi:flagellar FliJ protein